MILSILYDVKFIIGLLITLAVAAAITFYFTQRIEEQNEKIGAMSVVVQALVKELREPRPSYGTRALVPEQMQTQTQTIDLASLDEINDLIEVSDDGEEDSEDDEDDEGDDVHSQQTKSIQIGEALAETLNEINDIDVDSDSEESEGDSEDEESEDSSDDDDEDEDDNLMNAPIDEFIQSLEVPVQAEEVDESLKSEQAIYKTIHISLEGADDVSFLEVPRATDYKKMSLSELRAVVIANNLCTDSSKMKKQQLYKLLGVEQ
jgi:hypothetical protein